MSKPSENELADALRVLERHPDFRLLRRLGSETGLSGDVGAAAQRAVIVDTETTGTDLASDQIIELGMVQFEYNPESGAIGRILDVYDGFEDPGMPIPPAATQIHKITDAMVAGKRLDEGRVNELLREARLVIAHNAAFDRPLLERRMPIFATLPWGCSYAQIPWAAEGIQGSKLEYLAMHCGFFYDGHRSEIDCRALLEVLRRPLPRSGVTAFAALLGNSRQARYKLWATGSAIETKDILKARGYRWDGERRCWHRTVSQDAAQDEADWLKMQVFGGRSREIEVEVFDGLTNFSTRAGRRVSRRL